MGIVEFYRNIIFSIDNIPGIHRLKHSPRGMEEEQPTLIDLFSGCGGLGLGFHNAGFRTKLANELHIDPAATYKYNLLKENPESMILGSIDKVLSNKKLDLMGFKKGEITCISGGPPCQGFSNAGLGIANDPRNKLYKEYLRVIRKLKPKSILFENVPGFSNRYGLNLKNHLIKSLEKMGYETDSGIIQSKDYGVPQLRKRFVAIGVHRNFLTDEKVAIPKSTWNRKEINESLTASKVLDDLDSYSLRGGYGTGEIDGPDKYLKPAKSKFQKEMRKITGNRSSDVTWNTRIPNHTDKVQRRMRKIQNGFKLESLKGTDLETAKHSHRVIDKDKFPNITIVSIPDDYIHYNTDLPRTLSVRECARLQTFPDDFRFLGKRTTGGIRRRVEVPQYTQVANAIPPRMAEVLASKLLEIIEAP